MGEWIGKHVKCKRFFKSKSDLPMDISGNYLQRSLQYDVKFSEGSPYLDKNSVQTKICALHQNKALYNSHIKEKGLKAGPSSFLWELKKVYFDSKCGFK